MNPNMNVAVCFYTPETWEELRKVADDKKQLNKTYADWLVGFTKLVTTLKEQGIAPFPFKVDIQDLQDWCKKYKLKNNGENRAKYASAKATETLG